MPGVNDPVVFELLRKGVPNTAENYNRMAEALRVGGWTGGHQPVTAEMTRRGRSYMPMRGEESQPEIQVNDLEPVDMEYLEGMNEIRGAPVPQDKPPAPAPRQAASSPAPTGAAPSGDMAPEAGPMEPIPGEEQMTPIPGEQSGIDPLTAAGGVAALLATLYGGSKYMSRPGTKQPGEVLALPAPSSENRPPVERDSGAGEKYAKQQQQKAGAENQKRADDAAAEAEYERKRPYLEGQAKHEANAAAKKKSLRDKAVEAGAANRRAKRAKDVKRAVRRVK